MKDVTAWLGSYRECARHVWNGYFLEAIATSSDKWALRDEFDDVCSILFGSLVAAPLGVAAAYDAREILSRSRDPVARVIHWLHVVPKTTPAGVPIMINRDREKDSGYWDHPVRQVAATEVSLRFMRWFDFDELGFRDLKYFLVRVVSASRDDIVGRAALIGCEYSDVFLDEDAFLERRIAKR
jgi:hypothetical protein